MAATKLTLKLVVDTKANKVLYAEADKQFVDFLFHILSLPIGTAVKLLSKIGTLGCLGDLCKGFEALEQDYFQERFNKNFVLKPRAIVSNIPLFPNNFVLPQGSTFYKCEKCSNCITDVFGISCPAYQCSMQFGPPKMNVSLSYCPPPTLSSTSGSGGYVKGLLKYMVMDNLEVKPMSTILCVALTQKAAVEVKEVQVSFVEGLEMLKASFQTQTVLTSVFLGRDFK